MPAELIDRFVANPDLVVSQIPGPGFQSLWLNPWRDYMKVTDFDKPFSELTKEKGFMVRLAIAKAFDRADFIKRALFGRGVPAFGTINPAMGYFYDDAIDGTSEQRFDVAAAQKLMADAGYPGGKGFPTLKLSITPAGRREGQIIADILKRNLGITVELDAKDFPVLIDEFDANNYDLLRIGSGGDYDPDDGLVDWMLTTSKFNGPKRDKAPRPSATSRTSRSTRSRRRSARSPTWQSARRWSSRRTRSPPTRWRPLSCTTRSTSWFTARTSSTRPRVASPAWSIWTASPSRRRGAAHVPLRGPDGAPQPLAPARTRLFRSAPLPGPEVGLP